MSQAYRVKKEHSYVRVGSTQGRTSSLFVLHVVVSNYFEVWVLHCVLGADSFGMVISQHLSEEVKSFIADEGMVLLTDEFLPWLASVGAQDVIIVLVQGEVVLLEISDKIISSQYLGNLHELVIVVCALEEWLLLEYESSEHAAE